MSDTPTILLNLTRKEAEDIADALCEAAVWNRQQAPNMGPSKESSYIKDAERYEQLAKMLSETLEGK